MERLSAAFADKRGAQAATRAGTLELAGGDFGTRGVCDLLLDVFGEARSKRDISHLKPLRTAGGRPLASLKPPDVRPCGGRVP